MDALGGRDQHVAAKSLLVRNPIDSGSKRVHPFEPRRMGEDPAWQPHPERHQDLGPSDLGRQFVERADRLHAQPRKAWRDDTLIKEALTLIPRQEDQNVHGFPRPFRAAHGLTAATARRRSAGAGGAGTNRPNSSAMTL